MGEPKVYEEIADFIVAGTSLQNVIAFHPSNAARQCVQELVEREKASEISQEETEELEFFLQLEHSMRLARARAQHYAHSTS